MGMISENKKGIPIRVTPCMIWCSASLGIPLDVLILN